MHQMTQKDLDQVVNIMRVAGVDTQRYEVKSAKKDVSKDLGKTISAFSNGSGGAIICGLSEKHGFKPIPEFDAKSAQDSIANVCQEKMTPAIRPDIDILVLEDSPVVVATIHELEPKDKPCYVTSSRMYDGSYIRTGDGDRRLTPYEVDRLMDEHRQPRYDADIVSEASIDDLDEKLVSSLLERERRVHARNFAKLDNDEALKKLSVVKHDGDGVLRPTIAGLMALGEYPQQFFPRLNVAFACYPGTSKSELSKNGQRLLDSASIVGPIPYMVEEAIAVISRNMRVGALVDGAFRRDVPDYPIVALREAIANALMHRDYSPQSHGTPVQIDLYSDRLEITNPGGLFGNVTVDMLGKECISASRNQYLAVLLESTPYDDGKFVAENRGTGYQAIEASLADALMCPPIPNDSINYFSLTFSKRRISKDEMHMRAGEAIRSVILGMLATDETVGTTEVMRSTGKSRATVLKRINEMIEEGILETTEPQGSTKQRYRIARTS